MNEVNKKQEQLEKLTKAVNDRKETNEAATDLTPVQERRKNLFDFKKSIF